MSRLFLFGDALKRDPSVEDWFRVGGEFGALARRWFEIFRSCGDDVRELLHDGHPTACVGEAAFGYVNAFTAHVNVGFFRGSELADPEHLLQGNGKLMRHVKLGPGHDINTDALIRLIEAAYKDMKRRVEVGE